MKKFLVGGRKFFLGGRAGFPDILKKMISNKLKTQAFFKQKIRSNNKT